MHLNNNIFKTSDLYYAAFLKTAGFNLLELKESDKGRQKYFVFEDQSGLIRKTQTDYINGEAKVSAKDLIDNIRALKTLINME
ncbi:DUF5659 domain-containing protein [bacterium]|nr:DUF5659 domain-containing protein [bacterium]